MKISFVIAGVLPTMAMAFAAPPSTYDIMRAKGQIPQCAQKCIFEGALQTGCDLTDLECQCGKRAELEASVVPCASKACTKDEIEKTKRLVFGLCDKILDNDKKATTKHPRDFTAVY